MSASAPPRTRSLTDIPQDVRDRWHAHLSDEPTILTRYPEVASGEESLLADRALVITMATRYDLTTLEGQFRIALAIRTLMLLMYIIKGGAAYRVVIADSSPDHDTVRRAFEAWGATVLDARAERWSGIGPQNQLALAWAYVRGATRALKIDPEKYGLATIDILDDIVRVMGGDQYDILGIGRTPGIAGAGFMSLPEYQQGTERRMSRELAELGLPEDGASGIWAFNRAGMLVWLAFDTAQYGNMWQILWHAQLQALMAGFRLGVLFEPFVHPPEMVAFEEGRLDHDPCKGRERAQFYRDKRDSQADLVRVVVAYAATLTIFPEALLRDYVI